MKSALYFRLACTGIRKNRRLYLPYILTCIGMVMMYHILQALYLSPALREMKGGSQMTMILSLGRFVISVFSVIFLFYTNSFLIRRRNKEFGLYNILGMNKRALGKVIFWESLIVAFIGLGGGILAGTLLTKLAEMGLMKVIHGTVDYRISIPFQSIRVTAVVYSLIFLLLFLKSLWMVRRARPLELLRSESAGEKPPRANYLLGIVGAVILAIAYAMAVMTRSALSALMLFFVAVILVIIATYLLMIFGSVVVCRMLQSNKRYYYRKDHFISVSSMVYRMKRNGAGLASICILSTMVLVMLSSSVSLYIGAEDSINSRYPHNLGVSVYVNSLEELNPENTDGIREILEAGIAGTAGVDSAEEYRYAGIFGLLRGSSLNPDASEADSDLSQLSDLYELVFVPVADYNRCMGTNLQLEPGTTMIYPIRASYSNSELEVSGVKFAVLGMLEDCMCMGDQLASVTPGLVCLVSSLEEIRPLESLRDFKDRPLLTMKWYYGCDADLSDDEMIALNENRRTIIREYAQNHPAIRWYTECPAEEEADFYITFGGLFFLGIVLSLVFICAAALIIYYKQVCEGYEDQSRFAIMRKVGLTAPDIRKSVNSQVLTVFFAPLILAGVHLTFAFPMVWQLLQMFNLRNLKLVIIVTIGAFALFCVIYALIYKFTAGVYYRIVSENEKE